MPGSSLLRLKSGLRKVTTLVELLARSITVATYSYWSWTTNKFFISPEVLEVHLGEPHGGARAGAGHPTHDVEAVPGLVHHLAAAQNARPNCEEN